jgi:uncharacterized RDD family membrane protein YckC
MEMTNGGRATTFLKRVVAWIIDVVALTILAFAVVAGADAVLGPTVQFHSDARELRDMISVDTGKLVLDALLTTAVSAIYVVVPWSTFGASLGQLMLGLRVGDDTDGSTLTVARAVKRWLLLFPPFATLAAFLVGVPPLAFVVWAVALVWYALLLVTTALSETSQGLHDRLVRDIVRSE